jgi:hypothetical protein
VEKYGELDRSHMTVRRMHIACWIPKATDTNSEYVILTVLCKNGCAKAPALNYNFSSAI